MDYTVSLAELFNLKMIGIVIMCFAIAVGFEFMAENGINIIADGSRDEIFSNERVCKQASIRPPAIYSLAKLVDERMNCYGVDEFVEALEG